MVSGEVGYDQAQNVSAIEQPEIPWFRVRLWGKEHMLECFKFIQGYNTVSFEYNPQTNQWKFNSESSTMSKQDYSDDNKNVESFSQYGNPAADLLTKIHTIKRYLNSASNWKLTLVSSLIPFSVSRELSIWTVHCHSNRWDQPFYVWRIQGTFEKAARWAWCEQDNFTVHLFDVRAANQAIREILVQRCYGELVSISLWFHFDSQTCAVGGFLLNMIKKERDSHEKCYHNFFHDMLSRAYNRGMTFYMEITADWLNGNNLDNDPFLEVCRIIFTG